MTAAGADGVLAKLLAVGLIVRRPGRAGGFCVAVKSEVALGRRVEGSINALGMDGVGELDAAMAALDRLLACTSS